MVYEASRGQLCTPRRDGVSRETGGGDGALGFPGRCRPFQLVDSVRSGRREGRGGGWWDVSATCLKIYIQDVGVVLT